VKLEELVVNENTAEGNMPGNWPTDPRAQFTKRKTKHLSNYILAKSAQLCLARMKFP
jgi:hypothetical protein